MSFQRLQLVIVDCQSRRSPSEGKNCLAFDKQITVSLRLSQSVISCLLYYDGMVSSTLQPILLQHGQRICMVCYYLDTYISLLSSIKMPGIEFTSRSIKAKWCFFTLVSLSLILVKIDFRAFFPYFFGIEYSC